MKEYQFAELIARVFQLVQKHFSLKQNNVSIANVVFTPSASSELQIIQRGLDSFSSSSCIRFFPRSTERDYISIESRSGYVTESLLQWKQKKTHTDIELKSRP